MKKDSHILAGLPRSFTFLFCGLTLWLLFHDFVPALEESRQAERSLEAQIERYDDLVDGVKQRALLLDGLRNDPQEIERQLDQRGITPRDLEAEANGPGSRSR